jgi:hypothetical protein
MRLRASRCMSGQIALIVQGLRNKQIGYSLGAAEATIKKHRGRVFQKMNVQSVAELVTAIELMNRHPRRMEQIANLRLYPLEPPIL